MRTDGFSVVELLVVISIISLLMAISLPALAHIRARCKQVHSITNQKQAFAALTMFSVDNDDRFPESVATVGFGTHWNWQEPGMITSYRQRSPGMFRAMSSYLGDYIDDVSILQCPTSPGNYEMLEDALSLIHI